MIKPDIQAYFDREEFDEDGYHSLSRRDEKIRHIQLHVAKAALKMVREDPDVIEEAVLPDTAVYRSQLINLIGVDNIPDFSQLFPDEVTVFPEDDEEAEDWSLEYIVEASGELATYLERKEHGAPGDSRCLLKAAMRLHSASLLLGDIYDVDVDTAHINRLEYNLGHPIPESLLIDIRERDELG